MRRDPFDFVPANRRGGRKADFEQFEATELYCRECGRAVPVRKSLLLILPDGDKYEYRCQYCGAKVGDKIDRGGPFQGILTRTT